MTFPLEITIGNFSLSGHLLFETTAFVVGFRYFLFLRKRAGDLIDEPNRIWIIIGATFGAFLFSRLVGSLEDPRRFFDPASTFTYYYSQKTIAGGLFGGLLIVELTKKIVGIKTSSGDLFTYPIILAMIIGRIGCFTAGITEQTYGIETTVPWAMDLGDGLMRHPIALYEILFLIMMWIILYQTERSITFENGVRFKLFIIGYFIFRFMIDFIKPGYRLPVGITVIQVTCVIVLLYYTRTIFNLVARPNKLRIA